MLGQAEKGGRRGKSVHKVRKYEGESKESEEKVEEPGSGPQQQQLQRQRLWEQQR